MVATPITTEQTQGYVLRIHGNGEVFVEDVYKYLKDLEYAYNCAYVLDSITGQAEELARQYEKPPIPLRNLLWTNWWPPDAEKVARLVPDKDRLKLRGVKLNSPGFWDFMGKLNPLEVLRQYLNDRHKRRQDREYREPAEAKKLELENKLLEVKVYEEKFQLLKDMGANEQDIALLKDQMLNRPLQGLNLSQDQGLIIDAEIVNPGERVPKERRVRFKKSREPQP